MSSRQLLNWRRRHFWPQHTQQELCKNWKRRQTASSKDVLTFFSVAKRIGEMHQVASTSGLTLSFSQLSQLARKVRCSDQPLLTSQVEASTHGTTADEVSCAFPKKEARPFQSKLLMKTAQLESSQAVSVSQNNSSFFFFFFVCFSLVELGSPWSFVLIMVKRLSWSVGISDDVVVVVVVSDRGGLF